MHKTLTLLRAAQCHLSENLPSDAVERGIASDVLDRLNSCIGQLEGIQRQREIKVEKQESNLKRGFKTHEYFSDAIDRVAQACGLPLLGNVVAHEMHGLDFYGDGRAGK